MYHLTIVFVSPRVAGISGLGTPPCHPGTGRPSQSRPGAGPRRRQLHDLAGELGGAELGRRLPALDDRLHAVANGCVSD